MRKEYFEGDSIAISIEGDKLKLEKINWKAEEPIFASLDTPIMIRRCDCKPMISLD